MRITLVRVASCAIVAGLGLSVGPVMAQPYDQDYHDQEYHNQGDHDQGDHDQADQDEADRAHRGPGFHGPGFHGPGFHGGHDLHGHDYTHFSPAEREIWHGGHWEHGWHDGRNAWWWVAGGGWYSYPAPVYPYPTYVPPAQVWYYCDNPPGYYPYVAACALPWREVPAMPPPG